MSRRADTSDAPPPAPAVWTLPQRRAILVLLSVLSAYLIVRAMLHRAYLPDPQPLVGPRAAEVLDKLDPNTAPAANLAALPGLGEKRAADIVAYRERFASTPGPDRPAFLTPDDLTNVKGIGPAMVQTLTPYLHFPAARPATTPSQTKR